jgi:hypothetical protein
MPPKQHKTRLFPSVRPCVVEHRYVLRIEFLKLDEVLGNQDPRMRKRCNRPQAFALYAFLYSR